MGARLLWAFLVTTPVFPFSFDCIRGDETTAFSLMPHCEGVEHYGQVRQFSFRTNAEGLREREFSPEPAAGTYRILFVGSSQTMDIAPGVSVPRLLEEHLKKHVLEIGKAFRDVEVINASDQAGDRLRTYLRLGPLLEAYHPQLVLVRDDFPRFGLQQAFEYDNAAEIDEAAGLVKKLGYTNLYWPFPRSWANRIHDLVQSRFDGLRFWLTGLRMAVLQLRVSLGLWRYDVEPAVSPYSGIHRRHLLAMQRLAADHGAKLVVFGLLSTRNDQEAVTKSFERGRTSWFKPQNIAGSMLPWFYLKPGEAEEMEKWTRAQATYISAADLDEQGARRREHFLENDIHFSEEGVRYFAEKLALLSVPLLREEWASRSSSKGKAGGQPPRP